MSATTASPQSRVLTPTVGATARRGAFWVVVVLFAVIITLATAALGGAASDANRLSIGSTAPQGARALAEVLRQHGVSVSATESLAETRRAIDDPASTTLVVYDPGALLSNAKLEQLDGLAGNLILLEPDFASLGALAPDVLLAGIANENLDADCDLGPVQQAGTVSRGGKGYRYDGDPGDAILCLGSGDDVWSLIRTTTGSQQVTVVGATDALTNGHIVDEGNAAFALGLLGETDTLVWYLPSFDDLADDLDSPPSLAELSPPWVIPVATLVFLVALAAVIWRGRRFGPLVVENLPVIVRASETMEGRARLYQKSSARLRALDSLRIGTVARLATLCGLPRRATTDDVVAATASITGMPVHDVRALLLERHPGGDAELVHLSDELLELERQVASAVRSR